MGKHKHRTLRKRKINHKKRSTLKYRSLKYKKHYRGGTPTSSSSSSSPSNYSLKGMYSRLKSSLGITPHSISLNKIVKTVLKDIPKEDQDQFITTLKSNLTKWVKDLGNDMSIKDQQLITDSHSNLQPESQPEPQSEPQPEPQSGPQPAPQPDLHSNLQSESQSALYSNQQS